MHVWISQRINLKYNLKNKRHLKNKMFSLPVFPYPLTYLSFTFWLSFSTPLSVVAAWRTKYGMVFWEARNCCSALTGSWKNEYTWRLVEKGLFPGHGERKSCDLRNHLSTISLVLLKLNSGSLTGSHDYKAWGFISVIDKKMIVWREAQAPPHLCKGSLCWYLKS